MLAKFVFKLFSADLAATSVLEVVLTYFRIISAVLHVGYVALFTPKANPRNCCRKCRLSGFAIALRFAYEAL
jgi:hypothetical protein